LRPGQGKLRGLGRETVIVRIRVGGGSDLEGKWQSEDTWGGLDSGMVVMAPYTNMPDDVKKMAKDTEESIRSGKFHPFKCPIQDQDGKTVECKGGDHLDPSQILSMNWYVKGIDDKIPGK